jgi:nitrile hydratase
MPHDGHEPHEAIEHGGERPGESELLAMAVRALLVEKGIVAADEIRRMIEATDERTPELGRRIVARAWVDPEFRDWLLRDANAAVESLGIDLLGMHLIVVANTPQVHNLIVCTLCSCYPRPILGLPPDWYKSRPYRSRAIREPRAVLREFGTAIPDDVEVRVHDSTADMRYLVLPMRPAGTEGMSEADLAKLVSRDSMVGVALPDSPVAQAAE